MLTCRLQILCAIVLNIVGSEAFPSHVVDETALKYYEPARPITLQEPIGRREPYVLRYDDNTHFLWVHDLKQGSDRVFCESNNSVTRIINKPQFARQGESNHTFNIQKTCMFETFCESDNPYYPIIKFTPTETKEYNQNAFKFGTKWNFYLDFDAWQDQHRPIEKPSRVENLGVRLCRQDGSHHQLFQRINVPRSILNKARVARLKAEL